MGLHFSLKHLLSVWTIAVPGALAQIALATLMGAGLAYGWGWQPGAGLVFGLALSVASTVVLLKALQERDQVDSQDGRIAVGWLIVEDLAMVLTLVLLPALAGFLGGKESAQGSASLGLTLLLTLANAAFVPSCSSSAPLNPLDAGTGVWTATGTFRLGVLAPPWGATGPPLSGVLCPGAVLPAGVVNPNSASGRGESCPCGAFACFFCPGGISSIPDLLEEPLAVLACFILWWEILAAWAIVAWDAVSQATPDISARRPRSGNSPSSWQPGLSLELLPERGYT